VTHVEQVLELCWLLVAQVEEAVAGVVRVETEAGAVGAHLAARAHHEALVAARAELELALWTREVHAAAPGQREPTQTLRTGDAVLGQVALEADRLFVGVVGRLPLGELIARDFLVLLHPLPNLGIFIKRFNQLNK